MLKQQELHGKAIFQKLVGQIRWASTAICLQFTEASHVICYVEHFANVFSTHVVTKHFSLVNTPKQIMQKLER
ncbi:hypothetical protein CISIN_1g046474mg [Citrus sinensis]|uniref:Uncharacterized protein n=1 Tax=Citrus sinensis TaxID=2711 RepID=A0A067EZ17_CITSI|nr:hypothetical protein CISIN_1g046474mg [Citrus sinensis]